MRTDGGRPAVGGGSMMVAALPLAGLATGPQRPDRDGGARDARPRESRPMPTPTRPRRRPVTDPRPEPYAEAAPPAAPPRPARRASPLVMNGDLLWHNSFWYGAREDARRRGRLRLRLRSGAGRDAAGRRRRRCRHLPPGAAARPARGPFANYPRFSVPPQVVQGIKATGYDVCTTASNHSVDHGFQGLKRTLDGLDRARHRPQRHRADGGRGAAADDPHHPHRRPGRRRLRHLQPERTAQSRRASPGR